MFFSHFLFILSISKSILTILKVSSIFKSQNAYAQVKWQHMLPKIQSYRNALHMQTYKQHIKFKHLTDKNIITLQITHLIFHFSPFLNHRNRNSSTNRVHRAFNTNFSILRDILNTSSTQF